jgi:hypothetical protein
LIFIFHVSRLKRSSTKCVECRAFNIFQVYQYFTIYNVPYWKALEWRNKITLMSSHVLVTYQHWG